MCDMLNTELIGCWFCICFGMFWYEKDTLEVPYKKYAKHKNVLL